MRIVIAASFCVIAAGCPGATEVVCTDELRSTIRVSVRDSVTGQAAAIGSTVIVVGSDVSDSVDAQPAPDSLVAYVAWEDHVKQGTYTVRVRKPGYAVWQQQVVVHGDRCHSGPGPSVVARLLH